MAAPIVAQDMARYTGPLQQMHNVGPKGIFRQTMADACLACLCFWDVNIEMQLYNANADFSSATSQELLTAKEDTACCIRLLCCSTRCMNIDIHEGSSSSGKLMAKLDRPWRCPSAPWKCCCCHQKMNVLDASGKDIGHVTETCWWCVPNFETVTPSGVSEFQVRRPTCCNGWCTHCCPNGVCTDCCSCCVCSNWGTMKCFASCCCALIPFDIYDIKTGNRVGGFTKTGGTGSWFQNAHSFQMEFPAGLDPEAKMRVLGAAVLVNVIFFQKDGEKVKK